MRYQQSCETRFSLDPSGLLGFLGSCCHGTTWIHENFLEFPLDYHLWICRYRLISILHESPVSLVGFGWVLHRLVDFQHQVLSVIPLAAELELVLCIQDWIFLSFLSFLLLKDFGFDIYLRSAGNSTSSECSVSIILLRRTSVQFGSLLSTALSTL